MKYVGGLLIELIKFCSKMESECEVFLSPESRFMLMYN